MDGEKLKIVITKTHEAARLGRTLHGKKIGEGVLRVDYVLYGKAKEKISVISEYTNLTDEEKIVFEKMFMIFERLLKSNEANNVIGL